MFDDREKYRQAKQERSTEVERLKSLLKPGMKVEEVALIYPVYAVFMDLGADHLGRDFIDYSEFLEYFEGKKAYPKNSQST